MTMRIIVSDSSCLIDLRKASLLEAFLALPFEILIPNTARERARRLRPADVHCEIRAGIKRRLQRYSKGFDGGGHP